MQGRIVIGMVTIAALAPTQALAADAGRRQGCRVEQQQPRQKQVQGERDQQQRARIQECRTKRPIPPVVDPTPVFLL